VNVSSIAREMGLPISTVNDAIKRIEGKYDKGLSFDGEDDYVSINDSTSLSIIGNQITIEAWIKINSYAASETQVICKGDDNDWIWGISVMDSGSIRILVYSNNNDFFNSNAVLSLDTWHHVVVRYNGTHKSIFIDAKKEGERSATGNIIERASDKSVFIGDRPGSMYDLFFNGTIDNVCIYDRALNIEEIKAKYHEKSKFWINVSSLPASQLTQLYMYYGNPLASSQSDFDSTFTKDYGESGLVGLWHMDEGLGLMTNDSSGNGNHGTLVNGAVWESGDGGQWDGRDEVNFSYGSALEFDGIDDYVDCGDDSSQDIDGKNITILAWIKATASDEDYNIIVDKYDEVVFDDEGYRFFLSAGKLRVYLGDGLDANSFVDGDGPDLRDNKWHHVGVTYNGTIEILWLDGEVAESQPLNITLNPAERDLFLGINGQHIATLLWNFNGTMDEIRIFNRSLTQGEIRAYYERRKYANPEPVVIVGTEEIYQMYMPFGTYTSDIFDSGENTTTWNTINWWETLPPETLITFATRSGNTQDPDDGTWSSWSTEILNSSGIQITSPRSRYIQYQATLTTTNRSVTPFLLEVNVYYALNSVSIPNNLTPANGNWTSDNTPTFTWTFNDPESDSQGGFIIEIDDDLNFGSVDFTSGEVISSAQEWTIPTSIPDGTWYWHVKTMDEYGVWSNWSGSGDNWSLNIDTTPPEPPIDLFSDPDTWVSFNSFTIDWTNPSDFSGIKDGCWYKLGSPPTSNSDGTWKNLKPFNIQSTYGVEPLYVWLEDKVGNVYYMNYSFVNLYLDQSPPFIYHNLITTWTENLSIPIYATITDLRDVEEAILFYRMIGESDFTEVLMFKNGDNYTGLIPSSNVTSPGIDYLIYASDGLNDVTFPYQVVTINIPYIDVEPPKIFHNPIPNRPINQSVMIAATITDNIDVTEAILFYRIKGTLTYFNISMNQNGNIYYADIPQSNITLAGLEYYILAKDGNLSSTHPIMNPQETPHLITFEGVDDDTEPKDDDEDFLTTFWWLLLLLIILVVLILFLISRRRREKEEESVAVAEHDTTVVKSKEPEKIFDKEQPKTKLSEEEPEPRESSDESYQF
jgi:hypothetical protein